jgi:hypothetical protein
MLLFVFVIVFSAVVGCVLLASWTSTYNPAVATTTAPAVAQESSWLQRQLPSAAASSLTISVLAALFLLFGRMRRKPGNRLLSFILPLLISVVLIVAGTTLLHGPPGSVVKPGRGIIQPFLPKTIHSIKSGLVYVDAVSVPDTAEDGTRLKGVVLFSDGSFLYDPTAAVAVKSADAAGPAKLIPSSTSRSAVPIIPANPVYQPVFEPPAILKTMVTDVRMLNEYLLRLRARSPEEFVLAALAVSFFAMSCVSFVRLTRWPLFNALFILAVFRAIFLLLRFFNSDIGQEISALIPNQQLARLTPTLVYLLLGTLALAFGLLFTKQPSALARD